MAVYLRPHYAAGMPIKEDDDDDDAWDTLSGRNRGHPLGALAPLATSPFPGMPNNATRNRFLFQPDRDSTPRDHGVPAASTPKEAKTKSSDLCTPKMKNFFDKLDKKLSAAADRLNIDVLLLETLVALESEWYGQHAQDQNNIFGSTHAGKSNLTFPSLDAGIDNFVNSVQGQKIKGSKNIDEFIANLMKSPRYNTVTKHYDKIIRDVYKTMQSHRLACGYGKND